MSWMIESAVCYADSTQGSLAVNIMPAASLYPELGADDGLRPKLMSGPIH